MTDRLSGAETRARIIAATAAILEADGIRRLTVTRVMARAGVSRTAFYRHFTDPYEVLGVLLERIGGELLATSGEWITRPDSIGSPEVVRANLVSYARAYASHGRLLASIADAAAVDDRVHALWWDGIVQTFIDRTAQAIERDQAAGAVRGDLDARAAAYSLTLLGERASYHLMGRRPLGSPEEYAERLAPVWVGTLFGEVPQPLPSGRG
jgi:AcrR family transcriptional regulator